MAWGRDRAGSRDQSPGLPLTACGVRSRFSASPRTFPTGQQDDHGLPPATGRAMTLSGQDTQPMWGGTGLTQWPTPGDDSERHGVGSRSTVPTWGRHLCAPWRGLPRALCRCPSSLKLGMGRPPGPSRDLGGPSSGRTGVWAQAFVPGHLTAGAQGREASQPGAQSERQGPNISSGHAPPSSKRSHSRQPGLGWGPWQ